MLRYSKYRRRFSGLFPIAVRHRSGYRIPPLPPETRQIPRLLNNDFPTVRHVQCVSSPDRLRVVTKTLRSRDICKYAVFAKKVGPFGTNVQYFVASLITVHIVVRLLFRREHTRFDISLDPSLYIVSSNRILYVYYIFIIVYSTVQN